ncbi:MAG: hypothetical protein GX326_07860 [Clostridiaceae bacterium]|nr:hypothetical protein [Clostridiaceae bacterium]
MFRLNVDVKIGKVTTATAYSDILLAEERDKIADLFYRFSNCLGRPEKKILFV